MIPFGTEGYVTVPTPEMRRAAESRRRLELAEQRHRTGSPSDRWPVLIEDGAPASLIAQTAVALESDLVLTGPERHGSVGRLLHGETALDVSRGGETPVLLVPSGATTIPSTVVVGMDFSNTALHAARTAARVIGPAGTLLLVHVRPARSHSPEEEEDSRASYEHGVDAAFDGEPGRALLDFARAQNAGMLAVGSRGHTILQRFLVGSVATTLVRESRCAVLVSPLGASTRAR